MKNKTLLRIVSSIAALLTVFALVSCSGGTSEDESEEFEPITVEEPPLDFEPVDIITSLTRSESAEYAVATKNFGVDHTTFEALFNLVLYKQKTLGDGEYDEYEEYFASGALDPDGPVTSQKMPDSDLYWYAETRSDALYICFTALKCLEFSKSKGYDLLTRQCKVKINKEMERIKEGKFGADLTALFGANADETSIIAALAVIEVTKDPSLITDSEAFAKFEHPDYDVDRDLNPEIAPALK